MLPDVKWLCHSQFTSRLLRASNLSSEARNLGELGENGIAYTL